MTSSPPFSPLPTSSSSPSRSRSTRARKPIDRLGSYAKADEMSDEEEDFIEDDEEEDDEEWDVQSKAGEEDDAEMEVEGDDEDEEEEEDDTSKSKSKNSRNKPQSPTKKSKTGTEKSKSSPNGSEAKKKSSSMLPKPKTEITKTKIELNPSKSKSTAGRIQLKSVVKTQSVPDKSKNEKKIVGDEEDDNIGPEARSSGDDESDEGETKTPLNKSASSKSISATSKKATKPVSSASDDEEPSATNDEDGQKTVDSDNEEQVEKQPDNKAKAKIGKSSKPPLVTPKAVTPSSTSSTKVPVKNKIQLGPAKPKTYGTKPAGQKARSAFIPLVPKKVDAIVKNEPVKNKKSAPPRKATATKKISPKVEEEEEQTNQNEEEPAVASEPEEQIAAEQDDQDDQAFPPTPPPTSPIDTTSSRVASNSSTRRTPKTDETIVEQATPKKTANSRKGSKTKEPSLTPPPESDLESVASVKESPIGTEQEEDEEMPEETQVVLGSLVTDTSVEHEQSMRMEEGEDEVEPPEESLEAVAHKSPNSTPKKRKRTTTPDSDSGVVTPATPSLPSTPSKKKPAPAEKVTTHERELIMEALLDPAFLKKCNFKDIASGEMTTVKLSRHWRESLGPALKAFFAGDKSKSTPTKTKGKGNVVDSVWRQKMWDEVCKNCDKADWSKVVEESDSGSTTSKLKRHLKESMRKEAVRWIG